MLLVIPGQPRAQQRHRHTRSAKGNIWSYDPQARDKHFIREVIRKAMSAELPDFKSPEFPDMTFRFYMKIPKSLSKKMRNHAEEEKLRHMTKPDVDNMVKFYLDCLVPDVLSDDRGVKLLGASKLYSLHPRVEIEITEGLVLEDVPESPGYAFSDSVICESPNCDPKDVPTFLESVSY